MLSFENVPGERREKTKEKEERNDREKTVVEVSEM
tara:strand:- start:470 stop:574 length:105 start_codon:yes stop_codon:yes gene_type:complete